MGKLRNVLKTFTSAKNDYYYPYYDYQHLAQNYTSPDAYYRFFKKTQNLENLSSETNINILDKLSFKTSYGDVLKQMGKPVFEATDVGPFKIKILVFKTYIGDLRVTCEVHFFDKNMFACKYYFPKLFEDDKKQIISVLSSKYGINSNIDLSKHVIRDRQGYVIMVNHNFDLTFIYLNPNDPIFKNVTNKVQQKKKETHRRKLKLYMDPYHKL